MINLNFLIRHYDPTELNQVRSWWASELMKEKHKRWIKPDHRNQEVTSQNIYTSGWVYHVIQEVDRISPALAYDAHPYYHTCYKKQCP